MADCIFEFSVFLSGNIGRLIILQKIEFIKTKFEGKKIDVTISGTEGEEHENVMDTIDSTNVVEGTWTKFEIGIGRHQNKFQVFQIFNLFFKNYFKNHFLRLNLSVSQP